MHVKFSLSTLSSHCNVLQAVVLTHMGWIYGKDFFPRFDGFTSEDFGWAKGKECVALNLKLWRFLNEAILSEGQPWKRAHYIRPRVVYLWNVIKGEVDVYSRIMSYNTFQMSTLGSKAEFYIRAFLTAIYNVHILKKLLLAQSHFDTTAESYTTFRNRINQYASFKDSILEIIEGNFFTLHGGFLRFSDLMLSSTPTNVSNPMTESIPENEPEELQNLLQKRRGTTAQYFAAWNSATGHKCRKTEVHKEARIGYTASGSVIQKWCR